MAKRTSRIEKSLEILINVGNYESLRVGTTFGEDIEWSTKEERQKKLDAMTESLKKEVAKDVNDVLESFELSKRATTTLNKGRVEDTSISDVADAEVEEDDGDDEDFDFGL